MMAIRNNIEEPASTPQMTTFTTASTTASITPLLTVGIIADTHIPDRVNDLHPDILPLFRSAGVSHILHAGDISLPRVLDVLRQVAPVTAVRGNRDILTGSLRILEELELGGVRINLLHGHGGWVRYAWDKLLYFRYGYQLERYVPYLLRSSQAAQVVVFGHTHRPVIVWREGRLLINPGSSSFGISSDALPTVGLLHIYAGKKFQAEIVPVNGYKINRRKWVKIS